MHLTRGYHALALDFSLAVEDDEFARVPRVVARRVPRSGRGDGAVRGRAERPWRPARARRGSGRLEASDTRRLVASLVQWLNQQAVDPEYAVMSHAGGVERNGVACVLPADPESGKTTLTTGLVRAGYSYLTDEAISFDWETGEIEPYPKPLSIDPGSQFLFPELAPPSPPGAEGESDGQWQVPPSSIRDERGRRALPRGIRRLPEVRGTRDDEGRADTSRRGVGRAREEHVSLPRASAPGVGLVGAGHHRGRVLPPVGW